MSWSVEELWKYWEDPNTRNLIKNAQPLDMILGIGGDGRKEEPNDELKPLSFDDEQRVTTVDDHKLTIYPYQSVGRLYWCWPHGSMTWVTAFYIGKNTIMTAAHAFDDQPKNGVFVPAMINREDYDGKHYGCYKVNLENRDKIHPDYKAYKIGEPNTYTPQYDICTVKLGFKKGEEEENVTIDSAGLTPIPYIGDIEPNPDTTWIVLGYSCKGSKLTEVVGKYYEQPNNDQVAIDYQVYKGMSGGPWIIGDTIGSDAKANGCQAAATNDSVPPYSVSPYFSRNLFDILGLPS